MKYAELHGNMQMYGIKSLYGNKLSIRAMEKMEKLMNMETKLANMDNLARKADAAFNNPKVVGSYLPRRKVIYGREPG